MTVYHKCDLLNKQDWFRIYKSNDDRWYLEDSKSDWSIVYYCPWCGEKL